MSAGGSFQRCTKGHPCPTCGRHDWCRTFPDGGNECMRIESGCQTVNGGWMHWPNGRPDDWRDRLPPIRPEAAPEPEPERAPLARRNEAYRALLRLCPISDAHRSALWARGLDDSAIGRTGFGSFPESARERAAIVAALIAEVGEPERVPGFYRERGLWAVNVRGGGLLIPVRPDGETIAALQIRADTGDVKYFWFSSAATDDHPRLGGAGSGSPANVAGLPSDSRTRTRFVYATESILKSIVAAHLAGEPFIGCAGAGNANAFDDAVTDTLKARGCLSVALAWDMDQIDKPNVLAGKNGAAALFERHGFAVLDAAWDASANGADDALNAGLAITIAARPACAGQDAELARLQAELAEKDAEIARMAGFFRAVKAPKMGPERQTAAAITAYLAREPVGTWQMMPHAKTADLAGIGERAAMRHLEKLAPVFAGRIEQERRFIPAYGHEATFMRLAVPPEDVFAAIETHTPDVARNGHGGDRTCPHCGAQHPRIRKTVTEHCMECGGLISEQARDMPPVEATEHPDCHLDTPIVKGQGRNAADTAGNRGVKMTPLLDDAHLLPGERVAAATADHATRTSEFWRWPRSPQPSAEYAGMRPSGPRFEAGEQVF